MRKAKYQERIYPAVSVWFPKKLILPSPNCIRQLPENSSEPESPDTSRQFTQEETK